MCVTVRVDGMRGMPSRIYDEGDGSVIVIDPDVVPVFHTIDAGETRTIAVYLTAAQADWLSGMLGSPEPAIGEGAYEDKEAAR